jgi:hypothetical protein
MLLFTAVRYETKLLTSRHRRDSHAGLLPTAPVFGSGSPSFVPQWKVAAPTISAAVCLALLFIDITCFAYFWFGRVSERLVQAVALLHISLTDMVI